MRKALLLFLATVCVACSEDQSEYSTYHFFNNASIVTNDNPNFFLALIEGGNNLVFEYTYVLEADPEIADSGFSETLIFQIDPTLEEFSFSNNELESLNTYYRQICFCVNSESILLNTGTISGTKVNSNTWNISIDVSIPISGNPTATPIQLELSGLFSLEE